MISQKQIQKIIEVYEKARKVLRKLGRGCVGRSERNVLKTFNVYELVFAHDVKICSDGVVINVGVAEVDKDEGRVLRETAITLRHPYCGYGCLKLDVIISKDFEQYLDMVRNKLNEIIDKLDEIFKDELTNLLKEFETSVTQVIHIKNC